ncbi:hypothetical protein Pcinc_039009 [Petrolisthes cinctipes]|uniref:Photolyase/cryptochrome alpha/beta domain-containing protein n=1 Tax=Petrolisthes cinctipes TaxID=88211 RepID=A0AAE1EJW2_PETCI|nr:hypothetical protein Pcinc_039009 [Petrolisthes cinctipes]
MTGEASNKGTTKAKHVVHWFRKGLRLHDNPALRSGLKNASTFRCIFILDPWFAGSSNVGINKWRVVSVVLGMSLEVPAACLKKE